MMGRLISKRVCLPVGTPERLILLARPAGLEPATF